MELHEYFLDIAVKEMSIFDVIESISIEQCIENCFDKLKDDVVFNKHYLKLFRLLLCKQYQLNYEDDKNIARFYSQSNQFVQFLKTSKLCQEKENQLVLYDIMILQLVLLQDQTNFIQLFEYFKSNTLFSQEDNFNVLTEWYLRTSKCFLQAWDIYHFLHSKKNFGVLNITYLECYKEILLSSIINDLKSWVQCKGSHEWHALHSILLKIVNVAKNTTILSPYLHEILDKEFDLTALCIISNFLFPSKSLNIDIDYSLIYYDKLWQTIQYNLLSFNSYERKQALYLLKQLIDFINEYEQSIKNSIPNSTATKITPFICNRTNAVQLPMKQIRMNFILIVEVLEEKQKHLVIPSLSFVNDLIQGYLEHKFCGNCFDFSWIHCIFSRILMHDNNTVMKWGVLRLLKLDGEFYNHDVFIALIVKALNNTFLYEKYNEENEPSIVTALTDWFNNYQSENSQLVEKFISSLRGVSWGPVPIYYILQSLASTSPHLDCIVKLQKDQLNVIQLIMETHVKLHPSMLQSMSQIMLIKILFRFSDIQDLTILSKLLSLFSVKDLKEPSCWPTLVSWLAKVSYTNAVAFVNQICETLTADDESVEIPMSTFALIIQLLYEGGIICQAEQCIATQKLTTLLFSLDKVNVRLYVRVSSTIKIIDFLYNLFDIQGDHPLVFINKLFIEYKETLFRFILTLFNNNNFDYKYVGICSRASEGVNGNSTSIVASSSAKDLEEKCMHVLQNINEYSEAQLLLALQLWGNVSCRYKYNDMHFTEQMYDLLNACGSKNFKDKLAGKIRQDCYIALSKLIKNHVLTLSAEDLKRNDDWFKIVSLMVDAAGNDVLIYLVDVLEHYVVNAALDNDRKLESFECLIKGFWNCNFGSKRERTFWLAAQKLNKCFNSSAFLNIQSLKGISQEYVDRTLSEGDTLPGLKYILLTSSEICKGFKCFTAMILNGLLHGQAMRRDQRIFMQARIKGKKQLLRPYELRNENVDDNFVAHDFLNRQCNVDATIRAAAVIQLCNALHDNEANASLFLPLVIKKLLTLQNRRYFANSQLHRLKHRIYQILLILQPYVNEESTETLYNVLCDSIIQDSDQHSVRLMKEWLLIRIYISNESLIPDLWIFFDKICNKRPNCINSVVGVIWHVARQLSKEKVVNLIKTALPKLAVCCTRQQYGMRLFGQVFFVRLYELLDKDSDTYLEYSNFYKIILEGLRCANSQTSSSAEIDENFFYTKFNPMQHYCLEAIYHELPRLSNVSIEEWITKENFNDQTFTEFLAVNINIDCEDNALHRAEVPRSFLKSSENAKPEEIDCSETIITDIQKKMTPYKTMSSPNDDELTQMINLWDTYNEVKHKQQKFIMVASLIDKSQNLGGITRTCEIFGAKELVISNLKQTENKEFQTLSVSSDKWIKITEVKSILLDKYLLEMRDRGWTLIGAEQTVNSVDLIDFQFPEQTILILGNEKNGIPANILPLLDVCVQIPQFGVTRSLNVHVTSAICFWEYIKQHRLEL